MKELTYKYRRGIHPPAKKDQTADKAVRKIAPATGMHLVFPMLQHIGAECELMVSPGERVLLGQKIGDSQTVVSSPVHSSISGKVIETCDKLVVNGTTSSAVIIENDGKDEGIPKKGLFIPEIPNRNETLKLIHQAGVVGLGGAGFPTHVKLNPKREHIDTFIVNAAECEPYLTRDYRSLLEEGEQLLSGIRIVLTLLPEANCIIAVETDKHKAIPNLRKMISGDVRIRIAKLKPSYPQGAEKVLIYTLTGREVPSGGLPADVGCIVNNVDTVIAIERAVFRRSPLMRRIITLNGGAIKKPGNYEVRLGMTFLDFVEAAGGFSAPPKKVISGGPMMGRAMFTLDEPIIKTSSGLVCFTEDEIEVPEERNCIRCGRCVDFCPEHLLPLNLNMYIINGKIDLFHQHRGLDCIQCGTCSYVCPSKRHLAQSISFVRHEEFAKQEMQETHLG